jgi:anti-anti-sigma factor
VSRSLDILGNSSPLGDAREPLDVQRSALPVCTIRVEHHSDWIAVLLRGELDRGSAEELREAVTGVLIEGKPVIVELAGLDFCDVSGLRALTQLVGDADRFIGRAKVEVHGARGQVARLIELLGLDKFLFAPARTPGA